MMTFRKIYQSFIKLGIEGISIVSAYIAIVAIQLNIAKITHLYAKRLLLRKGIVMNLLLLSIIPLVSLLY